MISGTTGNTPMSDYGSDACAAVNWRHSNRRERTVDTNTVPELCSFLFCSVDQYRYFDPAMEK